MNDNQWCFQTERPRTLVCPSPANSIERPTRQSLFSVLKFLFTTQLHFTRPKSSIHQNFITQHLQCRGTLLPFYYRMRSKSQCLIQINSSNCWFIRLFISTPSFQIVKRWLNCIWSFRSDTLRKYKQQLHIFHSKCSMVFHLLFNNASHHHQLCSVFITSPAFHLICRSSYHRPVYSQYSNIAH